MSINKLELGRRIKEIRYKHGMNKTQFGKLFGATGSLVNKWENEGIMPSEKRVKDIAELENISVNELLYGDNPNNKIEVGFRIKNIRLELGETTEEFSKHFDPPASKGTISKWENGKYLPNNQRKKVISELGKITVNELLYGDTYFTKLELIQNVVNRAYEKVNKNNEALGYLLEIEKIIDTEIDDDSI